MVNVEAMIKLRAREYAYKIVQGEHGYTLANARLIYRKYYNYVVKYVKEYEIINNATKSMLAARDYGNYIAYFEIALDRTLNSIADLLKSTVELSKVVISKSKEYINNPINFTNINNFQKFNNMVKGIIDYGSKTSTSLINIYNLVKYRNGYYPQELYATVTKALDTNMSRVAEFTRMVDNIKVI